MPHLDGWRGVAILLVLLDHFGPVCGGLELNGKVGSLSGDKAELHAATVAAARSRLFAVVTELRL